MNREDIETFLTIVEAKSILKASELMYLSQSTVSQRLKNLENLLNVQLIKRHKGIKTIQLTDAGQEFVPFALDFLRLYDKMLETLHNPAKLFLRVGCSDSLSTYLLAPFLEKFSRDHEKISISVSILNSDQIYDMVEKKELDIGLPAFAFHNRNILTRKIYEDKQVLVSSYPLSDIMDFSGLDRQYVDEEGRKKKSISIESLNTAEEIYIDWGNTFRDWHYRWFHNCVPKYRVNTISMVLSFLKAHQGWTIAPMSVANALKEKTKLYIYDLEDHPPNRLVHEIVHRNPDYAQKEVREMFERELDQYMIGLHEQAHKNNLYKNKRGCCKIGE